MMGLGRREIGKENTGIFRVITMLYILIEVLVQNLLNCILKICIFYCIQLHLNNKSVIQTKQKLTHNTPLRNTYWLLTYGITLPHLLCMWVCFFRCCCETGYTTCCVASCIFPCNSQWPFPFCHEHAATRFILAVLNSTAWVYLIHPNT